MSKIEEYKKTMKKLSDTSVEPFDVEGQKNFEAEIAAITDLNVTTDAVVKPKPTIADMLAELKAEEKVIETVIEAPTPTPIPLADPTAVVQQSQTEAQRHAYLSGNWKRSWAGLYDLAKVIEYLEKEGYINVEGEPAKQPPTKRVSIYDLDDYARVVL